MQKIVLLLSGILLSGAAFSQTGSGRVQYARTVQLQISFQGGAGGFEQQMPTSRTDRFECTFGNGQSIWKNAEAEQDNDNLINTDGAQIRMVVAGNDDVVYHHFGQSRRVEKRELFDKTFILEDSIRPLKWKMTGETRTILGHPCMKATSSQVRTSMRMSMENGKMERKEVTDTSVIEAWFATDIPVSAGPAEYQGQLPGLILELDVANGRQVFKATEISEKADLAEIKEPTGKKRYTPAEFRQERDKMMQEMQKNMQGGNMRIRMN